jgi:hypothetical protein
LSLVYMLRACMSKHQNMMVKRNGLTRNFLCPENDQSAQTLTSCVSSLVPELRFPKAHVSFALPFHHHHGHVLGPSLGYKTYSYLHHCSSSKQTSSLSKIVDLFGHVRHQNQKWEDIMVCFCFSKIWNGPSMIHWLD